MFMEDLEKIKITQLVDSTLINKNYYCQSLASSPTVRLCVRASVSNMESDVYIQPRKSFEGMLAF